MSDQSKVVGAVGGAVGLGSFAAALGFCCAAPWAVTLLGVTGAVALARLEFLLPYALGAAAALLGMGFWLAYRRPADCLDGTCAPKSRRVLQWVVWTGAVLVAALAIFGLVARVTT
jgi:mercuric ion transport protein